jgi:hypothetical protein
MRAAAAHSDLSSRELLSLVTASAAAILRMPDRGDFHVGQRADCLIVRAGSDPYGTLLETDRNAVRAVVRGGAPAIADPDFADWFEQCGVATVPVCLDGRPKLLARHLARPDLATLEPGLEIDGAVRG